jgi:hypothetical protein
MQLPYHFIIIFLGAILSFFLFFKKGSPRYLKYFFPFLITTLLCDSLGWYISVVKGQNSLPVYNLFTAFEFLFYLWVIWNVIQAKTVKKILFYILIVYPVLAVVIILLIQKIHHFHSITYGLGCLLVIFFCIYYFFELFRVQHAIKLISEPAFWICTALLFFYCCTFPLFVATNFLDTIPVVIKRNAKFILTLLNVLLYSLFIIAFLCKIKIRKSSSLLQSEV